MNPLKFLEACLPQGSGEQFLPRGSFATAPPPPQGALGVGGCYWHLLDARDIAQHVTVRRMAPTTMNYAVSNTLVRLKLRSYGSQTEVG